jgi:hypothetical protein
MTGRLWKISEAQPDNMGEIARDIGSDLLRSRGSGIFAIELLNGDTLKLDVVPESETSWRVRIDFPDGQVIDKSVNNLPAFCRRLPRVLILCCKLKKPHPIVVV